MFMTTARLKRLPDATGDSDHHHTLVWALFSSGADGATSASRDFQFRETERCVFTVVSERPPEDPHRSWTLETAPYSPALSVGDRLSFVLRANPAVAVPQPGGKRGKRVDAIMHAASKLSDAARKTFGTDQAAVIGLEWLYKRAPNIGVTFDPGTCRVTDYRQVRIPRAKRESAIEFSQIEYAGELTVTDPEKLQVALFQGIGKAKTYGCGLMLVRPA
jgi:CRISPR system Cascade subunit CasE